MSDSSFDWDDHTSIAIRQQDTIAVYANEASEVVIRRQRDWNEDDDSVIVVSPACSSCGWQHRRIRAR